MIKMLPLHIFFTMFNNKVNRVSTLPPQFFEMVIRFLAEGAASGLNVIAVYVTEILRVTGFDGGYTDCPCFSACSTLYPPYV